MKQHPILFSSPMIQAILEGRKTMTRRIVKPQPIDNTEVDGNFFEGNHKGYVKVDGHPYWRDQFVHEFSKKQVGDILWVRETHFRFGHWREVEGEFTETGKQKMEFFPVTDEVRYYDNPPENYISAGKTDKNHWYQRPSIFMPKEACRLYLEITGIRVERLQDISEQDAVAEGVQENVCDDPTKCISSLCKDGCSGKGEYYRYPLDFDSEPCYSATESFQTLWESINGPESWTDNPFVWVIQFKKIVKP